MAFCGDLPLLSLLMDITPRPVGKYTHPHTHPPPPLGGFCPAHATVEDESLKYNKIMLGLFHKSHVMHVFFHPPFLHLPFLSFLHSLKDIVLGLYPIECRTGRHLLSTRIKAHCCSHTMGSSPYLLD